MDLDFVSKKELRQYPAILTVQAWSIAHHSETYETIETYDLLTL